MHYTLTILLLAFLFNSCKSDSTTSSYQNTGPTGSLKGSTSILDTLEHPAMPYNGILIQVDGANFSTLTDSSGNWEIKNVPLGEYVITESKQGCDAVKNYNIVVGGDFAHLINLWQVPRAELKIVGSITADSSNYIHVSIAPIDSEVGVPTIVQMASDVLEFESGNAYQFNQTITLSATQPTEFSFDPTGFLAAGHAERQSYLLRIAKRNEGFYFVQPEGRMIRGTNGPWSNIVKFSLP